MKDNTTKNYNNSFQNIHNCQNKQLYKTDLNNDDNISDKANSVQTSYKYRRNKNCPNSISSKESCKNNHYFSDEHKKDDEISVEISENDNLICPNCINCTLIEEKQKRLDNERNLDKYDDNDYDYTKGLYDKNRIYDLNKIDEKRRQREFNTNEAFQNLAKINAGMSNKDKLIKMNENSRNPLNEGGVDYRYQKFQDEYNKRQKMINDNIGIFYPDIKNQKKGVESYYDNNVYNPNYNKKGYNKEEVNRQNFDRKEYINALEDQINYKNELKKREKEEERRRGQRQYEEMRNELKREEEERYLKERKQRDELIKANAELIKQKNKMKLKELEEKVKYREMCEKENEEYQRDLKREQLDKIKRRENIYNQYKNDYLEREKRKEAERQRHKEEYDDGYDYKNYYDRYKYGVNKYGDSMEDRVIDDDKKYNRKYDNEKKDDNIENYEDKNNNIIDNNEEIGKHKIKERMGRCCRCHKIFPRKLLTINRYFYKENRK